MVTRLVSSLKWRCGAQLLGVKSNMPPDPMRESRAHLASLPEDGLLADGEPYNVKAEKLCERERAVLSGMNPFKGSNRCMKVVANCLQGDGLKGSPHAKLDGNQMVRRRGRRVSWHAVRQLHIAKTLLTAAREGGHLLTA